MYRDEIDIILEAYIGKTKELVKCEGYIREIINQLSFEQTDMNGNPLRVKKQVTKDFKYNKLLEEELRDFFKVKEVNIWWQGGTLNAYTTPTMSILIADHKRQYLNGNLSSAKIDIVIFEEVVTLANLTEQEVLATILHEIGHNFYLCPITLGLECFATIVSFPSSVIGFVYNRIIRSLTRNIVDLVKKHMPALFATIQLSNQAMYQVGQFLLPASLISMLANSAIKIKKDPVGYVTKAITGYGGEVGADSMSAKYGYGPEQASALRKLTDPNNTALGKLESSDKSGTVGLCNDFALLGLDIVALLSGDPHPNNSQRASNMLKKLKKDLSKGDYPPEMKKDLEQEIARMEDMYNVVMKNNSSSDLQMRKSYYDIINRLTDGNSDIRQVFSFYFDSFSF